MKVFVYYNIRKKVFSVKALEGPDKGRVIAHAYIITLKDVTFKVSKAGQTRVRNTGIKNVHAGIIGHWVDYIELGETEKIMYNPYKYDTFVKETGLEPVQTAAYVHIRDGSVHASNAL